jgi:hypothetical protein
MARSYSHETAIFMPRNSGCRTTATFRTEMKEHQHHFLSLLGQLPARLTAEEAAWVLNCQPHDMPVLIVARLLKPLGNPAPNSIKFFATADILESAKDRHWLTKVTATINQHWQKKNQRKRRLQQDVVPAQTKISV